MYKKITHTIVEEHFDHPVGAEIKHYMEAGPKAMAQNLNQAINFRFATNNYFSKMQMRLRNYVTDLIEPKDDATTTMALQAAVMSIEDIAKVASEYYGAAAGVELKKYLIEFASAVSDYIKVVKAGQDPASAIVRKSKSVDDLAKFLSSANPAHWPAAAVTKIFSDYAAELLAQAEALIKKDRAAVINSENKQHDIILGNVSGITGLADVFASGIIRQFPEKFAM